jgi:hypothetical protein
MHTDYTILTFARCGSNYLQQLIRQKLRDPNSPNEEILIPKTHFIPEVKTEKMISIIRCPYETMHSLVALVLTFPDKYKVIHDTPVESGDILINGQTVNTFDDGIYRFPAMEYIEIYKHLIDNDAILIDYRDLVSRPDEVIAYLAKELNLELIDVEYVNGLVDTEDHLVSSTSSPLWNTINYPKHLPGDFKMFECKTQFDKAIEKCILR